MDLKEVKDLKASKARPVREVPLERKGLRELKDHKVCQVFKVNKAL